MRILAISDIHGCLATFKALLATIQLSKKDRLFLVGDFVDRGPDSKGVIDYIWQLESEGYQLCCLQGNHEVLLLKGLDKAKDDPVWLLHGGKETLKSFGVTSTKEIPKNYTHWMQHLPLFVDYEKYIFVHAGLNFKVNNPLSEKESMLWIREWYDAINYEWLKDRIIIHGHTPTAKKNIQLTLAKIDQQQYLDIDAGCVFNYPGFGHLCAVDLSNRKLFFEKRK